MRILFDGYWWHQGPHANRTVQRELIRAWAQEFPEDEPVVALRSDAEASGLPAGGIVARTRLWPHALSNRWELPRLARRTGADVAVVHNYTPASGRSVVFIHDAMFAEHPEWFSRRERLYFAPMLPWAADASVVATSTRTEAARIRRHAPSLAAPVVTGLGIPPGLEVEGRRPPAIAEGTAFAVSVGRLNVRKNLETVMAAAARSSRITSARPLCIVGGDAHSGVGSAVPEEARPLLDDGSILMLGPVPDEELAWLYAHAAVTVSLSLDEGFGMPCLEAVRFGSPLIASDIPVFRETVGGCAVFVDPLDADAVATAIDAAWGHRPEPAAVEDVLRRFTWASAARSLRAAIV
ncbi:glycosyltransferase family 1 protein [Agrococcus sp. BE272]|uniref:glycosyltransferase family 4 protein n=1 Tax=Agrococcus sp. BE272 TaxID=2817727 RepID=UPI002862DA5B|nr:glycosyltransferase family 1 protein [Agrococcus sp. BE272]MDR7234327.1 glycosyltransferase involved in cell wall biosynthesis [Agrococcus sp. BE272]